MSPAPSIRLRPLALGLALALAACGGVPQADDGDALEAELAADGAAADPLLRAVVNDPIMTDPQLSARSNVDAIRPSPQPYSAPIPASDTLGTTATDAEALLKAPEPASGGCPECAIARDSLTLAALAARQADRRIGGCAAALAYGAGWANRLPPAIPLHPAARVVEAAGIVRGGCALRAASFTVARPLAAMLDWYHTKAVRAGYSSGHKAEGGRHVLAGTRTRDDGVYLIFLVERDDGGTDVVLIANNGR